MSSMSSTRLNKLVGILFYFFNLQNKKNAETVISYVWTSFGYSLLRALRNQSCSLLSPLTNPKYTCHWLHPTLSSVICVLMKADWLCGF